ncbi:hypothetical protein [Sinorhizobium fredii]|uniref:hypothetical protein n=1 Tax=Rhizobium fredii TaxID=380 RepID=UPI0004AEA782|nr:hypothetical protein [Sinorhizobium fredii]
MRYRISAYPEREARSGIPVVLMLALIAVLSAYLFVGDMLTDPRQQTHVYPPDAVTMVESAKRAP